MTTNQPPNVCLYISTNLGEHGSETILEVSVGVQGDRVAGDEPDVLPRAEDDDGTVVERLSERTESADGLAEVVSVGITTLDLGKTVVLLAVLLLSNVGDKTPDESGCAEENRAQERGIVVSEFSDERSAGEGTGGSCDLVKNLCARS